MLLAIVIVAIGNRTWGAGTTSLGVESGALTTKHWMGMLVMWLGFCLKGYPPVYWTLGLLALLLFRAWATRSWNDMGDPSLGNWPESILRSVAILPLAVLEFYLDGDFNHLIGGLLGLFIIPSIYWGSARYLGPWITSRMKLMPGQFDYVAAAEFMTGLYLGVV